MSRAVFTDRTLAQVIAERLGFDIEAAAQEAEDRQAAAAVAAAEAKNRQRADRDRRLQALRWQAFADEIGGRVRVEIDGEEVLTPEAVVCPHCGTVPGDLIHLTRQAGILLLASDRRSYAPFQPVNYPDTDRRWMTAPHIKSGIVCTCGGDFDLAITVLPRAAVYER